MNKLDLYEVIAGIDDGIVDRAMETEKTLKRRRSVVRTRVITVSIVASAFLVAAGAVAAVLINAKNRPGNQVIERTPGPKGGAEVLLNDDPHGSGTVMEGDWPYYNTAEEIVGASSNIYTGSVTDISFEIINEKTGEIDRSPDSTATRGLYTVYTVAAVNCYKGSQAKTRCIRVTGTPKGYREDEQNELLVSAGLVKAGESLVYSGSRTDVLEIGKAYVFCTVSFESVTDAEYEINPTQFALDPASEEAKRVVESFK